MEQRTHSDRQTFFTFVVLVPIFLVFSLLLSNWFDGRKMDFGQYWQGGYMILTGQNVYDTEQWIAVRSLQGTALHSESTFQYPLPFAILFSLLALLPIQIAYTVWLFFGQVAILISILILLRFYPERTGYFELLTIGGIFSFRPMFSVFNSGQILPLLILVISLSIKMFHDDRWFMGGAILSILSLKPSIGFTILILTGFWLLSKKKWRGIMGILAGGFALAAVGLVVNYKWIVDYISVGGNSFSKYFGMHPTLWGAVNKIFGRNGLGLTITIVCVAAVLAIQVYLFWRNTSSPGSFGAFASIVPAALLVAPYSWNYEQVLLMIPIVFLLIRIAEKYGTAKAALFMLGIAALAILMVAVAYRVRHDVWSVITSFVVWLFVLYFVSQDKQKFESNYAINMPSVHD